MEYYFDALKIAKETHYRSGEANYISDIGSIYTEVGNYHEATDYYRNALIIFREIGEKKPLIEILINLCSNYLNLEQSDSAFINYKLAVEQAKTIHHKELEASAHYCLGNAYRKLNDTEQAIKQFNQALKISQMANDLRKQS